MTTSDLWQVRVTVPMSLPLGQRNALFVAVADAVEAWEPDDRDGWDADVEAAPVEPTLEAE